MVSVDDLKIAYFRKNAVGIKMAVFRKKAVDIKVAVFREKGGYKGGSVSVDCRRHRMWRIWNWCV
jgi:hypothetical protein